MEKQHNRGQDGAGIAAVKFDIKPGQRYLNRLRSNAGSPIDAIFKQAYEPINKLHEKHPSRVNDVNWLKEQAEFVSELYLGHLRYGTFGKNNIESLHPVVRFNNWITRNLVLAGNFNMTNVDELFKRLIELGQYPVETSDTVTILEKIGHFLDTANDKLYEKYKQEGRSKVDITKLIAENIDIADVLRESAEHWDGGYAIAGLLGHGDAFVLRDPSGIRPAYWYQDDEIVVAASERPVIQTVFNVSFYDVKELTPGHALVIPKKGTVEEVMIKEPNEKKSCSFERIYFSRGSDKHIYQERKQLGKNLTKNILEEINNDLSNTVFSYIPNTAASAFYGLVEELNTICDNIKREQILSEKNNLSAERLEEIFKLKPRTEKVAVKDIKLRTFITQDSQRDDLVAHVYDITYGTVRAGLDNLVVIDDSIVRGTTLKKSIIRILDRLEPKKIVIASSAPQIRYPDCYGIDMAKISDFVAFNAAIELLKENKMMAVINDVYKQCKEQENLPKEKVVNAVKQIYAPFSDKQIAKKVAQMVTPNDLKAELSIVYQSIEDLHSAIPNHRGDWYFTGDYPTPGGNKVVNKSFINYIEKRNERAY